MSMDHSLIESQLKAIAAGIAVNTYSSLRNFNQFKQQLIAEIKKCKSILKELRKSIGSATHHKLQLLLMKNELIAFEMRLIGNCIKSDHFKDFYLAKSYLQLDR